MSPISTKTIEFPYRYEYLPGGVFFYPHIPVSLNTIVGWKEFLFIVDTGADYTTLPYRFLRILGIQPKKLTKSTVTGIGGFMATMWLATITIRIGPELFPVRCSIVSDDKTPLLLGRIDLLDNQMNWYFDSKRKKIIFEVFA